jgi:hypothetical protein
LVERDGHLARRGARAEERLVRIRKCEERIRGARAVVFAADDGRIGWTMGDLEREWRLLSRPDPDACMMDLWARVAPRSWLDSKKWRGSEPAMWLDAALALASDPDGVDAAEAAALSLCRNAPGKSVAPRVRWQMGSRDSSHVASLYGPLVEELVGVAIADREGKGTRAFRAAEATLASAMERLPDRPMLASDLGLARFIDEMRTSAGRDAKSPVAPLMALWRSGYAIAAVDANGIALELPDL